MMISRGLFGWSPPHIQPLTPVSEVSEPPESPSPYVDASVDGGGVPTGAVGGGAEGDAEEDDLEDEEVEPPPAAVPFSKLFAYADRFDGVLMVVGSLAAAAHGTALVFYLHYFAKIVNVLHLGPQAKADEVFDRFREFCLKSSSHGGGPRAGTLLLGGGAAVEVETPSLLLSTCKGLPHFVSPDMLPSLPSPDSRLLHLSPLHFLEAVSSRTISKLGGLHQMLGLQNYGFVALPRDSIRCLPSYDGTNKIGASFETPCGRCLIKPSEYVEMISSMRPNIWVTLADEVPAWVSDKRNRTSVDRTLRWMDECISFNVAGGDIFGAVVGGSNMLERQRCAKEVAKRSLSGYWIGGFGLGESIDERPHLLKVVCECLPAEKPRLICGLGLPEEILQGVNAGVDLFDSTYIYHITIGGFALTFPLSTDRSEISPLNLTETGSDSTKINLRSTAYRKDATPIVEGCECYTCRNHTKAYINHLLNVHEMLAQTLLEIHNTYHFLGFFRTIREAIKGGYFEQFRRNFVNDRRDHLCNGAV